MPIPAPTNPDSFRRLVEIMEALLSPEGGCPWDAKQTHKTLKPYVIEEAHEVCEAIDDEDPQELCGELGDLGLQIVFHSALAKKAGHFEIDDVYQAICEKLIRRHPHVFADTKVDGAEAVLKNWEAIKREERVEKNGGSAEKAPSALDGVPTAMPALQRAQRLQTKAARVGFDWGDVKPVLDKIREETDELEVEIAAKAIDIGAPVLENQPDDLPIDRDRMTDELGDMLFAIVNLARFLKIDPEQALQGTNRKFLNRFHYIEERLAQQGKLPTDSNLEEMDKLWEEAKGK
jgi:nucleoside triphosphate diphosphatase